MINTSKVWLEVLSAIENVMSQANFSTWFKETELLCTKHGVAYVGVPNSFTQEWLQKKFHNMILGALQKMDPRIKCLEYVIKNGAKVPKPIVSPFMDGFIDEFIDSTHVIELDDLKEEVIEFIRELKNEAVSEIKSFILETLDSKRNIC